MVATLDPARHQPWEGRHSVNVNRLRCVFLTDGPHRGGSHVRGHRLGSFCARTSFAPRAPVFMFMSVLPTGSTAAPSSSPGPRPSWLYHPPGMESGLTAVHSPAAGGMAARQARRAAQRIIESLGACAIEGSQQPAARPARDQSDGAPQCCNPAVCLELEAPHHPCTTPFEFSQP